MKLRTLLTASILALAALPALSQSDSTATRSETWKYIPKFGGTMRVFYRNSTTTGDSRFELADARLTAGGYVMPWLDYYIQVNFNTLGSIKILDAYATVTPVKNLHLMAGQMRVPYCVEATRAPSAYYFADVALTCTFGNLRSVGVKAGYTLPKLPLYFEGGVFNASDMTNHNTWNSALTYSIKANYTARCGLKPEIAFMSRVPGGAPAGVRVNQYDASLSWTHGHFFTEAEYIYRLYAGSAHKPSQAWNFFVSYGIPVKWRMANEVSFQARFDGITAASSGTKNDAGELPTTIAARRRVTVGATATKRIGKLETHFRINYEQYFYGHTSMTIAPADNNQLIAGIMLHF